ncbi:hypothetical protein GGD81_003313 [Rhodobium orientis]|uniref:TylF/MycF/NovP-related O-methyltransferase n=1 Tax=Rhodobium orientis TaxID=34017 RepID=UPI0014748A4A|nr:TylF/MycF/NovP-related O-methyltransferase [Rhodobium orientis]MBB4304255.1 hypothetical protein [Rhodobium orientis]
MIGRGELTTDLRRKFEASEDADFLPIWEMAKPHTMTSFERGHALFRACRYVVERQLPGAFVECGVWQGGSAMIAMLALQRLGAGDREFFLFDTFDGMTPPTTEDMDWQGHDAEDLLEKDSGNREQSLVWAMASIDVVRENIAKTGYNTGLVTFIEGDVSDTLPKTDTGAISILRLDTDFYRSTLDELVILYPRLTPQGVLIVDDYGHWQGARRAVDEYFSRSGDQFPDAPPPPLFHWIDYTGRMAVRL